MKLTCACIAKINVLTKKKKKNWKKKKADKNRRNEPHYVHANQKKESEMKYPEHKLKEMNKERT